MKSKIMNALLSTFVAEIGKAKNLISKDGSLSDSVLMNIFNDVVLPMYRGTDAQKEMERIPSGDRPCFMRAVVNEICECIFAESTEKYGDHPNFGAAVGAMVLMCLKRKHTTPLSWACEKVRLLSKAPMLRPYLNPKNVRTFKDEIKLEKLDNDAEEWSRIFRNLCEIACR